MSVVNTIEIQGHRGCRGLLPENTMEGFINAIELGVQTLEMDVVVSKDGYVVVSHEAFFNHEISTLPDGQYIEEVNEKNYNLFMMNYEDIKKIDVGLKPHPRFPKQKKIHCQKPLLSEVIEKCDSLSKNKIHYNIEIKRRIDSDGMFNPPVDTFIKKVYEVILNERIEDRTTVQSFDHETLTKAHEKYPNIRTVMLVEDLNSPAQHLKKIGYIPFGYSPNYKLVDEKLVRYCLENKMKLIPWTVNDQLSIATLIDLKVDGIITDYPDLALKIVNEKNNLK